jgi:hypothetical protein
MRETSAQANHSSSPEDALRDRPRNRRKAFVLKLQPHGSPVLKYPLTLNWHS